MECPVCKVDTEFKDITAQARLAAHTSVEGSPVDEVYAAQCDLLRFGICEACGRAVAFLHVEDKPAWEALNGQSANVV